MRVLFGTVAGLILIGMVFTLAEYLPIGYTILKYKLNQLSGYSFDFSGRGLCVKEGHGFPYTDWSRKQCCSGLQPVMSVVSYNPDSKDEIFDGCSFMLSTSYTCVKCGDGICGQNEQYCNCKADCPEPSPSVTE
jgi:hypothetical protein